MRVRCANKGIELDSHRLPQLLVLTGNAIRKFLWRHARRFGGTFNLLTVFIRAGGKEDVQAEHLLVSSDSVCNDRRINAPTGRRIHIVEGCCDVESLRHKGSSIAWP